MSPYPSFSIQSSHSLSPFQLYIVGNGFVCQQDFIQSQDTSLHLQSAPIPSIPSLPLPPLPPSKYLHYIISLSLIILPIISIYLAFSKKVLQFKLDRIFMILRSSGKAHSTVGMRNSWQAEFICSCLPRFSNPQNLKPF